MVEGTPGLGGIAQVADTPHPQGHPWVLNRSVPDFFREVEDGFESAGAEVLPC